MSKQVNQRFVSELFSKRGSPVSKIRRDLTTYTYLLPPPLPKRYQKYNAVLRAKSGESFLIKQWKELCASKNTYVPTRASHSACVCTMHVHTHSLQARRSMRAASHSACVCIMHVHTHNLQARRSTRAAECACTHSACTHSACTHSACTHSACTHNACILLLHIWIQRPPGWTLSLCVCVCGVGTGLHNAHFTLRTSPFTLRTSYFTLHTGLHNPCDQFGGESSSRIPQALEFRKLSSSALPALPTLT